MRSRPSVSRTSLSRQIVVLALLLVTAFVVIIWASILSIRSAMDRQASIESLELMRGRIGAVQEQVALIASDYHNWTDVFQSAVEQDFEELYSNYGITAVRGDIFQYAQMFDGPFDTPAAWQVGVPRESLGSILSSETMDNLRLKVPELDFSQRETIDYFDFRTGSLVMFSASLLLPEDVLMIPEAIEGDLAIAVIGKILSERQLAQIQTELNVSSLRVDESPEADRPMTLPLNGSGDRPVAYLSWQPPTPGTELFRRMQPVMAGVTVAFLVLTLAVARLLRDRARELVEKEAEAATLARVDPLTRLPNRLALREHLDHLEASGSRRFAVLSLDIDRFKQVNDIIGHAGGDIYLKKFSERLRVLAAGSTFVSRPGGDEFIMVVSGDEIEAKVAETCRNIQRLLRDKVSVGGYSFDLCAAKGLAVSDFGERAADEVLLNADRAMYSAKQQRTQDVVRYDLRMETNDALDNSIEKALRSALTARSEFYLEYQPIVSARFPGGIVKFEALARWNSSELGRVSPCDFIRIAETTGLILPLGKLLLEIACDDIRGNSFPCVSINISAVQLMSPNFAEEFCSQVRSAGLDCGRIEIEITETIAISDNKTVASTLHELRSRGFSIALDDFGTGFSSVGYLANMPFNVLKIDRSFISGEAAGERSMTMVKSMISLAHSLSMAVVAEGVEGEGEATALRNFGCDMFQGYHYGRPGPLGKFFDAAQMELDLEGA